jgi:hypothetical protein
MDNNYKINWGSLRKETIANRIQELEATIAKLEHEVYELRDELDATMSAIFYAQYPEASLDLVRDGEDVQ